MNEKRNKDIVSMREHGATYREIGAKYGISVERVRQLYKREKRRPERERILEEYKKAYIEERAEIERKLKNEWPLAYLCKTRGTRNRLMQAGIKTEKQLMDLIESDKGICIWGIGEKRVEELNGVLHRKIKLGKTIAHYVGKTIVHYGKKIEFAE